MKYCQSLMIGGLIIGFLFIPKANANHFPDIRSVVLEEAIRYLIDQGRISGYPDGFFRPEKTINRAETLKIIFFDKTKQEAISDALPFIDTAEDAWYSNFLRFAVKKKVVEGYLDKTFRPHQAVSKVEFLKILLTFFKQDHPVLTAQSMPFSDIPSRSWYRDLILSAVEKGYLDILPKFFPGKDLSRGEAALILYRFLKKNEVRVKNPVLSCETCVQGFDLKEQPWFQSPLVKVENGKLFIDGIDNTGLLEVTSPTDTFPLQFAGMVIESVELKKMPKEEKLKRLKNYPDYVKRARGIHGGEQDINGYFTNQAKNLFLKNKDGIRLEDCPCGFEMLVIREYATLRKRDYKHFPGFELWKESPDIYDVIYAYVKDPPFYDAQFYRR